MGRCSDAEKFGQKLFHYIHIFVIKQRNYVNLWKCCTQLKLPRMKVRLIYMGKAFVVLRMHEKDQCTYNISPFENFRAV